jgi:inner membrane protein
LDNLTHTLIGIGIARAGLAQKFGRGTTLVLAVASNLPDIDVVCVFGGPLAFLWRRGPTHCLLGAAILIVVATFLFRRYYPNLSWHFIFGLTALGVAGHLFADLWNAYGVILFWPFDLRRVSLNWIYIIDLCIWGILIVCWSAARLRRAHAARIWQVGLCVLAVYIGICAWCSRTSRALVETKTTTKESVVVYPEPLGPERFHVVVQPTGIYENYLVHPFSGEIERLESTVPEVKTPTVEAARQTETGHRLDAFFGTPVWRESSDHQAAIVYGLEFRSAVLRRGFPFTFRVTPQGQVSREPLRAADAN